VRLRAKVGIVVTGYQKNGTGGANAINGRAGVGFIQKRGDAHDTITNAANYTKSLR
jgi:hypothetical protein